MGEVGDGGWLELFLDDEVCYDDARDRVVSGLQNGWVCGCEMIRGEEGKQSRGAAVTAGREGVRP